MSHIATSPSPASAAFTLETLQRLALWLLIASGWFVLVEPAPYELLFAVCLVFFLPTGLNVPRVTAPFIIFLTLYNVGGIASLGQVLNDSKAVMFTVVSVYMAVTSMFLAFCVAADPMDRMAIIRNAYVFAGVLSAITGMIGYFNIGGMGAAWAPIERAQGTFKDPNVLSTFLIPPAIFLIQGFLLGTIKWRFISASALLIILAALFLAFSRGAWISMAGATLLLVGLTFIVTPSLKLRMRIIVLVTLGAVLLVALIALLLSIEQVRMLFTERASLVQNYDAGETGRFGRQLNSIPLLLDNPFGFGPVQFRNIFGGDPHNVYLNAFASYGWLGGISYILLILATLAASWKAISTRTPWQHHAIAVFCPLFTTILQGVQIDTDHWRHFYLLVGLIWGLYAAAVAYRPAKTDTAIPAPARA
ncbi:MAG: O-antigen ligase family protein [Hyphomicrobiales bacterium]